MSYACLHLDAKTAIARTSIGAWNALMRADPHFGRYALSDIGRSAFIAAFTIIHDGMWSIGGQLHRTGGPAVTYGDGGEAWYERGEIHRIGGPAIMYASGGEAWYERGELHRIGGPAIIYTNGNGEAWYERNKLHRIGGPAIIDARGRGMWFEYGKPIDQPHTEPS